MSGLVGIVLALALLIWLAYRGVSVLVLGPLCALLAVLLAGAPVLASYTQVFMPALGRFIVAFFPLFLLGAVFGKLMEDSGSARSIAQWLVGRLGSQRSIMAVVLACAVLTYGGVSLFVVAFAIYPIAAALFRTADIPKRLIPAAIALGAFTFTMTALPGTPAIQNAIPMPYFGTTAFAAPGLGVIAGLIMFALGMLWLRRRERSARATGEGYGEHPDTVQAAAKPLREHAAGEGFDLQEVGEAPSMAASPSIATAAAPVVAVIALNYLFSAYVIPALDTKYLARPELGATSVDALRGLWSIIAALVLAIVLIAALNRRSIADLNLSIGAGANASVMPIFNTASQVGFGAVIASLPAFALIRDAVLGLGGGNPLISLSVAVNILAGITGSASGGMSIALSTLGDAYVQTASATGVSMELMHRVTSIATGGLDALPHNGAVITLLGICHLTHRESYWDIFIVAVVAPISALVAVVALGTLVGSF